jgi:DNA polymerase-3 subunit gamma/tau
MILLRMLAFRPAVADAGPAVRPQSQPQDQPKDQPWQQPEKPAKVAGRHHDQPADTKTYKAPTAVSVPGSILEKDPSPEPVQATPKPAMAKPAVSSDWREIVNALGLGGLVKQLAINCTVKKRDGNNIVLQIETGHANLINPKAKQRLQQALGEYFNIEAQLEIEVVNTISGESPAQTVQRETEQRQQQAVRSINEDSFTQTLKENFNAEIIPGSVKPVS